MSLINQVLNDLEQRRAETAGAALPREVRPLPAAGRKRWPWIAAGSTLAVLVAGGLWAWQTVGPARPLPEVPSLPAVRDQALPPLALPIEPAPGAVTAPVAPWPSPATAVAPSPPPAADVPAASPAARTAPPPPPPAPGERLPSLRLSAELSRSLPPAGTAAPAPAPADAGTPAVIDKQVVDANPQENAERLYRAALVLFNQGRGDDGLTTLRAALREDPLHVAARQTLVKVYVDSRAWDAAQGVLRDGLSRLPAQAPWALLLARLLADRGDPAGALQVLEAHDAAGRASAAYQAAAGAMLQRLDRPADAVARYEQATRLEPASGRWWLGLATAFEGQGRAAEAREAYQRALAARNLPADLQAFAEGKLR